MGKKRNLILAGLISVLCFPAVANAATTKTVCASGCDFTGIAEAIASEDVAAGDTIKLNESLTVNATITVDKSVTIDLNGHDITGEGVQYVFNFNAKDTEFTLTDSTDEAGTIANAQRGILVTAGELTFDKVTLTSEDRTIQINPVTDGGAAKVIVEGGVIESTGTNATRTIMLWGNNVAGEASLVVNGGEIIAPISSDNSAAINLGSANAAGNTVEINGGKITGHNGVRLYGNGEKGMTVLTMNGGSISAVNAGILQSAAEGTENTEIYLYGGSITAKDDAEASGLVGGDAVAIHHTQTGILVIGKEDGTGPTLTGETAVAVKEGDVTVNGGTIIATGEYRDQVIAREDGTEDSGAAISITSSNEYTAGVTLKITGGNLTSQNGNALFEGITYTADGEPTTEKSYVTSMEVTGGTFTSAEDKASVVATYAEPFITGGTYSSQENLDEYTKDEIIFSQDENGNFVAGTENLGDSNTPNDDTTTPSEDVPAVPQTFDALGMYAGIGAISIAAIAGAVIYLKRRA